MNAVARTLGLMPGLPRDRVRRASSPSVQGGELQRRDVVVHRHRGPRGRRSTSSPTSRRARCGRSGPGSTIDPDARVRPEGRRGVRRRSRRPRRSRPRATRASRRALSPIDKVVFTRQDDLTAALIAGDVDAMSADSPVTGFAIKLSGGALEPAGDVFDSAAVRLAGGQGLGAGGVAAASARAPDADRRVPDHRHDVGRREGHDRQAGHQRRDQVIA